AHSDQLRGADVIVLNDNDPAGYEHADATCKLSLGIAKRVRRLDLALHWAGMPKGADVSDWLALGHTREELDALIASAPDYQISKSGDAAHLISRCAADIEPKRIDFLWPGRIARGKHTAIA